MSLAVMITKDRTEQMNYSYPQGFLKLFFLIIADGQTVFVLADLQAIQKMH
jgi:hypothetical protein